MLLLDFLILKNNAVVQGRSQTLSLVVAAQKFLFSGPARKRGLGKGLTTKKKITFLAASLSTSSFTLFRFPLCKY